MPQCFTCGKSISFDEVGLYKKMVNRGSTEFQCKECLSENLKIPISILNRKIIQFKQMGCLMFTRYDPEKDILPEDEESL